MRGVFRHLVAAFVLLASVHACAPANAQSAAPDASGSDPRWMRYASEHFEMLSCTSPEQSREMLSKLEQFRIAFFSRFFNAAVFEKKVRLIVFDTRLQLMLYAPLYDGKPKTLTGAFASGPLESWIVFVNEDFKQGLHAILHEYVHSLVAACGWTPPLFFNEGLAEFYATFETAGGKGIIGSPLAGHLQTLSRARFIPLDALFTIGPGSPYYNESDQMNIFYAESWLLVHYMMCGDDAALFTSQNLVRFFDLLSDGKITASVAFQQVFGMTCGRLENDLRSYLRSGRYLQRRREISQGSILDKITMAIPTQAEVEIELAGLRWQMRQPSDAPAQLQMLAEKYPGSARVYEIAATVALGRGNGAQAAVFLRKAAELNSQNPMTYAWLLRCLCVQPQEPLEYRLPETASAELRRYADRALELAPNCMEAQALLALVESQSIAMRVPVLNKVVAVIGSMNDEQKERALLALGVAYWREGNFQNAQAVLATVIAMPKATAAGKRIAETLRGKLNQAQAIAPAVSGQR